jgi:hypothetical protein
MRQDIPSVAESGPAVSGKEVRARFQCNGTAKLADGTLAISALQERHADQDVTHISVVGGTGAYFHLLP